MWDDRYHDGGRLSDQQMALLQYQQENIHFLNEEVCNHWSVVALADIILILLLFFLMRDHNNICSKGNLIVGLLHESNRW